MSKKLTTEEFINRSIKVHGDKYNYSKVEYKGMKYKINILCPSHGIFKSDPKNHIHLKAGCPKCAKNYKDNLKSFIKKSNIKHNDLYNYSKVNYRDSNTKVEIICNLHGSFFVKPSNHLTKLSGCPNCNLSKGELKIYKYLEENNIKSEKEKKFNLCRNNNILPFDFYLHNFDILIEYDGEQHFKPIEIFGGEKKFKQQKINDNIKNKFCKDYNIKLIRINYKDIKNIEKILKKELNCKLMK